MATRKRSAQQGSAERVGKKSGRGSSSASGAVDLGSEELVQQVSDDRSLSVGRDELGNVPSDLAKNFDTFCEYQDGSSPRFLCYRPNRADPPFPLVLLEEAFSSFLRNAKDVGNLEQEDIEAAARLCQELNSREFVSQHEEKVEVIQELLSDYWRVFVHAISIKKVTTDASVVINQLVALILEFKAVLGVSGDPYPQGLDYVRRCCRKSAGRKNPSSQYGLLLCFAGPNIQVSGYFYDAIKEEVWCEPLTWNFCYGPSNNVKNVAALLRAVKLFCVSYVSQSTTSPVPWKLRSLDMVVQPFPLRNLFVYSGEDNVLTVAKYARSYSEEAHRAWSSAGVAPKLLKVENDVADGWKLLHMEYLEWTRAERLVREHREDASYLGRLSEAIEKAARVGHGTGFVHGDLRLPNVLVEPKSMSIKFVDFDWAGAIGVATYPEAPSSRLPWHPEVRYKQVIAPDHDLWLAKHLVEQMAGFA